MLTRKRIIGLRPEDISRELRKYGFPINYGVTLAQKIYRNRIKRFSEISNVPKAIVNWLEQSFQELYADITYESYYGADGSVKYLFSNAEGQVYESIYMDHGKRNTLCISSQAGCRMGCKFCLTGSMGFKGNLDAGRIVEQLLAIPESKTVNRLVIMGMGEPLDNYTEVKRALEILTAEWGVAFGKANITLSSVGIIDELEQFLQNPLCNLAISLHSPFAIERAMLMPSENSNPIEKVVDLLKRFPLHKPLRLSFEYVALSGINLTQEHARAIAELMKGLKYHLNIIPWNEHSAADFKRPTENELESFTRWLNRNGVLWTIRQSKGNDVGAACGQMAGKQPPK